MPAETNDLDRLSPDEYRAVYEQGIQAAVLESRPLHTGGVMAVVVAARAALLAEIQMADTIRAECQHDRDQHALLLREVLSHFTESGHPGEPCVRTGWIARTTVVAWHARVGETIAGDWRTERAELLGKIASVREYVDSIRHSAGIVDSRGPDVAAVVRRMLDVAAAVPVRHSGTDEDVYEVAAAGADDGH